jgi:hypothetical protein
MNRILYYVNQGLKTWAFSVPKNPEFEHVILNSIQNLFENWRCQHQKDSASGCGMTCQGIFRDANRIRLQLKLNP